MSLMKNSFYSLLVSTCFLSPSWAMNKKVVFEDKKTDAPRAYKANQRQASKSTITLDEREIKELQLAAKQEDANAQFKLGVRYYNGKGVPKDEKEALRWWRFAAEHGHAKAQYNLGVAYATGSYVPKDEKKAVKRWRFAAWREAVAWWRLAAKQEHVSAYYNLGVAYATGNGVPKDEKEAINWYRLAAEKGHAKAQSLFNLGAKYYTNCLR